ncbi:MAG TPA: hypothetical protein VJB89_00095 [Candidatus Nanoarchaeia archaeon]|nr:hypothetical protein [Candidatus Nanoarchaeia archaeon]
MIIQEQQKDLLRGLYLWFLDDKKQFDSVTLKFSKIKDIDKGMFIENLINGKSNSKNLIRLLEIQVGNLQDMRTACEMFLEYEKEVIRILKRNGLYQKQIKALLTVSFDFIGAVEQPIRKVSKIVIQEQEAISRTNFDKLRKLYREELLENKRLAKILQSSIVKTSSLLEEIQKNGNLSPKIKKKVEDIINKLGLEGLLDSEVLITSEGGFSTANFFGFVSTLLGGAGVYGTVHWLVGSQEFRDRTVDGFVGFWYFISSASGMVIFIVLLIILGIIFIRRD